MKLFEITDQLTPAQIKWLTNMGITKYTYEDGKVDVPDDVDISKKNLTSIPVQFGMVSGNFYCYDNNLTSLAGAPREVGGRFYCFENKLTSIAGAPREVGGNFSCSDNKLTSLVGAPKEVGENFYCNNNFKSEPDHSFIKIDGDFNWK